VNLITDCYVLPERRLLRGGKLDFVQAADDIYNPRTIVNLRKSVHRVSLGATAYDFAISNDYEKYDTGNREVQRWLNKVIRLFEDETFTRLQG
jgi:hypothetical protein